MSNKFPLLISTTLFLILLALRVERDPISIIFMLVGAYLGTFMLDLDYFVYAYFFEPEKEFSKQIRGYVTHGDLGGAMEYILYHKNSIKDKTLNSALFQIAIAGLSVVIVGSNAGLMLKSLILSIFVNSLYRMVEEYYENRLDTWFWAFKNKPRKESFYLYCCGLLLVLLFSFSLY